MKFRKYKAHQNLKDIIRYYWTMENNVEGIPETFRFVPDGFVEWVFHLGEPWSYAFAESQQTYSGRGQFLGHMTRFMKVKVPANNFKILCVKFYPWAARDYWKFDMNHSTSNHLSFADVNLKSVNELEEKILQTSSIKEQIEHLNEYFTSKLSSFKKSKIANLALTTLCQGSEDHVPQIGKRRIQQLFKSEIGISQSILSQTARINRTINDLIQNPKINLTSLAYNHNYVDQSHLIKSFQRFTGGTPSTFLKQTKPDGDIFNLSL